MTLAEIMVCIAVIAVVITMVVSFATLMSDRAQVSNERLEIQQELAMLQSIAEAWVNRMTEQNAVFSLSDSETVTATVGDASCTLSFAYGSLTGTLPDGTDPLTVRTERIQRVVFTVESGGSDTLIFCTVTTDEDEVIFAINPRIGDTVGG